MINRRVLVVDDNEINRKILNKMLADTYIVYEASHGQEALDVLVEHAHHISAILLDLSMPIMDGYEFLRRVKSIKEYSNIPVIVTTQQERDNAEIKALSLGASDFLTKPYKALIIRQRLANLIDLREQAAFINVVEKDTLTHLYSKEAFYHKVSEELKHNDKYKIISIDLLHFKLINDLYGMIEGDKVLIQVSETIKKLIDNNRGIASRFSSDNFIMLLKIEVSKEEILAAFKDVHTKAVAKNELSFCFGAYYIDDINVDVNLMCDRAILAGNKAKENFNEIEYYDDKLRDELLESQDIANSIALGIENDELEIYYQPKCLLSDESLAGAEALVRWHHPTKGFLNPLRFIPILEKNGLITQLDLYVFECVCKQLKKWVDEGIEIVPISVNFSRVDIYLANLDEILINTIRKYELSPKHLRIEITESAYMETSGQLIEVVNKLREKGLLIEMDDFGSGYSSLNMMTDLPIDTIKLDMAFLKKEKGIESTNSITAFTIALAKQMGYNIIAEGVETKAQADLLKSLKCEYAQGFYYDKPLKKDEFRQRLINIEIGKNEKVEKTNTVILDDEQLWNPSSTFNKLFESDLMILAIVREEDGKLLLSRANERFYESFGLLNIKGSKEKPNIIDLIIDEQKDYVYKCFMGSCVSKKELNIDVKFKSKEDDEHVYIANLRTQYVDSSTSITFVCSFNNINSYILDVNSEEYKESYFDFLTGVYNRRGFIRTIESRLTGETYHQDAFFILDIDNFKNINDTLGHVVGDEVIKSICDCIYNCIRKDDVIGRFGGDELMIIIKDVPNMNFAIEKGNQICKEVYNSKMLDNVKVSVSIGSYIIKKDDNDFYKILDNADKALYVAKENNKNCIYLYLNSNEIIKDKIKGE